MYVCMHVCMYICMHTRQVPLDIVTLLSYLGIYRRETVVGAVHEGVIDNLEKVLIAATKLLDR